MVNVHFVKGDECKRLAMVEMGHGDEIYEGNCYWKRHQSTSRESEVVDIFLLVCLVCKNYKQGILSLQQSKVQNTFNPFIVHISTYYKKI
jgi:hypothetical protein